MQLRGVVSAKDSGPARPETWVTREADGNCDLGVAMHDETVDFGQVLIDVTGMSLRDLDAISESRLAETLQRVLADDETGPVAGFTSRV